MKEKYRIGSLVMADNASLAQEPIFVFGYISNIEVSMRRTYYSVDWIAVSNGDESVLGTMSDYEEDNIFIYCHIFEDWMNGRYDQKKDYKKPET